jgi:hypothetical protein
MAKGPRRSLYSRRLSAFRYPIRRSCRHSTPCGNWSAALACTTDMVRILHASVAGKDVPAA